MAYQSVLRYSARPVKRSLMLRAVSAGIFAFCVGCFSLGAADSLFKEPIISVRPKSLNFGSVPAKTTVTNSVLVENWGGGKLVGKVMVDRPFKVISGGTYRLGANDAQVVMVAYTPTGEALDTNVLKFTGGNGAVVSVVGKCAAKKGR
jgi:hypothetical protein